MTTTGHPRSPGRPAGVTWMPLSDQVRQRIERRMADLVHAVSHPLAQPVLPGPGVDRTSPAALAMAVAALAGDGRGRSSAERQVSVAAAVELLHLAAAAHDDGVDGRRHAAGAGVTADLLVAAALIGAAPAGATMTAALARAVADLRLARQAAATSRFDPATTPDDALGVARRRTGSLARVACVAGAAAAGLPARQQAALGDFGDAFGVIVHVVDEILDLVSTPELTGRAVGVDLAAGTMSLPVCHAVRLRPELADLLRPDASADDLRAAHVLVLRSGAVAEAMRVVLDHAASAERTIRGLDSAGAAIDPAALDLLAGLPAHYLDHVIGLVVPRLRILLYCAPDGRVSA